MADEKKIIEIKVELTDGVKEIGRLVSIIDALNAEQKENTKLTEEQRTKYAQNAVALKEYRAQLSTMVRETRNEIKATNEKLGYIQQLKAQVSNLTLEYERLTQAELQGDKGAQVLTNLKAKRDELSKLEQAYGNYTRNVGNYSSATNNLAINLGMVMKELPNFAISARIGIMSLTNNLPMLAEAIKAVRVEQQAMVAEGKAVPSMFSLITKSVFGLTGIISLAMVALQLFSGEIIRFFTNTSKADESIKKFNKSLKDGEGVYSTSAAEIGEIETHIRLASQGFLDADSVLKTYNEKLGDTFGAAQDLNGAMRNIVEYKTQYISAMVEMAASQLIFEEATRKASEALALERQGKPSFWASIKTVVNTVKESFDVTTWGIMSLPNTLSKIANTSTIVYQNYLNDISKLRNGSFKDMQSYQAEIDKIAAKYKDEPFFAALFGIQGDGKAGDDKVNYKDSAAWKEFEARYEAYSQLQEMLAEIERSQAGISKGLTKDVQQVYDNLYNSAKKAHDGVMALLPDFIKSEQERHKRMGEEYRRNVEDAVYYEDLKLATAELNNTATLENRLSFLKAQEDAEILSAISTDRSINEIKEYYAAQRMDIARKENEAAMDATAQLLGSISSLWEESTIEYKIFASAQAVMNAWLGVTNALANTKGGIVAQVAGAATALVSGLAAVKKIWSVNVKNPTTGGSSISGGSVPADTTSKMSAPLSSIVGNNASFGGSSTIASGASTSVSTGSNDIMKAVQSLPPQYVTVKDIDIATKRVKVIDSIAKVE